MALDLKLPLFLTALGADIKALFARGAGNGVHAREPGLVSGRFVSQGINASALSTISAAANRLDYVPFIPARDVTINQLAIEVTTLIAASLCVIGINASDANGNPGARLETSGNLDCATAGVKVYALPANRTLVAGTTYWVVILSSGTQTYRGVPVAALQSLGHDATLNAVYTLRRATSTFASGLPATAPSTTLTAAIAPWFRLQIA